MRKVAEKKYGAGRVQAAFKNYCKVTKATFASVPKFTATIGEYLPREPKVVERVTGKLVWENRAVGGS